MNRALAKMPLPDKVLEQGFISMYRLRETEVQIDVEWEAPGPKGKVSQYSTLYLLKPFDVSGDLIRIAVKKLLDMGHKVTKIKTSGYR